MELPFLACHHHVADRLPTGADPARRRVRPCCPGAGRTVTSARRAGAADGRHDIGRPDPDAGRHRPDGHIAVHHRARRLASRPQAPSPRYGYVLSGSIVVTNVETHHETTFRTGDMIVEDVGRWHEARNDGNEPVVLLVMDFVGSDGGNVVLRDSQ